MARKTGSVGARTAEIIREASIRLIAEHGFEAMSLRQLAAEVGVQPSSLYNHIPNKQALLYGIMRDYMEDLLASGAAAVDPDGDPMIQLKAFVAFHVRHHVARKRDLRIMNLELRSLEPEQRNEVVSLRDAYDHRLQHILEKGMATGVFAIPDSRIATFAIIALLTGIAAWWRPDGRLSVEELVSMHQELVLAAVGARRRS